MPRPARLSRDPTARPVIDVVVGILADGAGRVLIGRRPAGKPMAGRWEFPGGKLEPEEAALTGLARELGEELGVGIAAAERFLRHSHGYPDFSVRLDVWWVLRYTGSVVPLEGQELAWVGPEALAAADMLPADGPIVSAVCARLAGA